MARRLSARVLGAGMVVVVALAPASAGAEVERPAQLDAANAVGLAYTRIAPAATKRVCLVDSGVAANADTARVVTKLAIDGGPGDDTDSSSRHGTSMAMHMVAERNGEGMVGVWPVGEVVSYRAAPADGGRAPFNAYYRAVRACTEQPQVSVVNLSLAESGPPSAEESSRLSDLIAATRANGILVTAAAGNDGGAVGRPAGFPGVLTIAAGSGSGFCSFASRGSEVEVLAPGCDLESASPFSLTPTPAQGSSQAAAMVAQVAAALRSYKPTLTVAQVEDAVRQAGSPLDVAALFRAQGLLHVIEDGLAAAPARQHAGPPRLRRFQRPRPRRFVHQRRCRRQQEFLQRRCRSIPLPYRLRGGRLRVRVLELPVGAGLEIRVLAGRPHSKRLRTVLTRSREARTIAVRAYRRWRKLALRFIPTEGVSTLPSRSVFISRR